MVLPGENLDEATRADLVFLCEGVWKCFFSNSISGVNSVESFSAPGKREHFHDLDTMVEMLTFFHVWMYISEARCRRVFWIRYAVSCQTNWAGTK